MVSTQTIAADWLSKSSRFQVFPPCPKMLEEEVFKQQYCCNTCSARPNGPLGTIIRTIDWCWECCDVCWRTMRVSVHTRWHSQHGMGHTWAPQDSPAAGATRHSHGLSRRRTRGKTGRRTRLWRYISGKIVELMS